MRFKLKNILNSLALSFIIQRTGYDRRCPAKYVLDLIHAKFARSLVFTYKTDLLGKFEVADLFEDVEVGDYCGYKGESKAYD